ncbi:MAG: hypothetical protein KKF48_05155 [Nanoarchaeota archaeon]|nr:hypothetical protein [Nanoarchaeota archaeon]
MAERDFSYFLLFILGELEISLKPCYVFRGHQPESLQGVTRNSKRISQSCLKALVLILKMALQDGGTLSK